MASLDYDSIADLYDSYVTVTLDVPFYLEQARGCRQVLELMSGTGRVSLPLLETGVPLTCVDSSPKMLDRLRDKLEHRKLHAEIREMDVCQLDLQQQFDLVILPFHSFAEITEVTAQRDALHAIRRHLAPGGRFICPLHNPPARLKIVDGKKRVRGEFSRANGEKLVLSSFETCAMIPGIVRGKQYYDIYDENDRLLENREVDIAFYLHTPGSFGGMVVEMGYKVKEVYGNYGRAPFDAEKSPFMIWILGR